MSHYKKWIKSVLLLMICASLFIKNLYLTAPFTMLLESEGSVLANFIRNCHRYGITELKFGALQSGGSLMSDQYQFHMTTFPGSLIIMYGVTKLIGIDSDVIAAEPINPPEWIIRLVCILFSTLALVLFYLITRRIFNKDIALLALFFAAMMPAEL